MFEKVQKRDPLVFYGQYGCLETTNTLGVCSNKASVSGVSNLLLAIVTWPTYPFRTDREAVRAANASAFAFTTLRI